MLKNIIILFNVILKLNQLLFYYCDRWCRNLEKKTLLQLILEIIIKMSTVV